MDFTVVNFAGRVLRHIGGTLLLCWRRMASSACVAGGAGLLLAEVGGSSVTHQIPAPIPAQIVAVLFAIGLGYGVALTALLVEIIAGAVETARLLEGEAGAGARAAAIIGERADRELSGFVGWIDAGAVAVMSRFTGRRSSTHRENSAQSTAKPGQSSAPSRSPQRTDQHKSPRAPAPIIRRPPLEFQRTAPDSAPYAQAEQGEIVILNMETLAEIAATDEFITTAPRPKVNARPVPANQLPRIEWTYEQLERQDETGDAPLPATLVAPLERQMPPATPDEDQPPGILSPVPPLPLAARPPTAGEAAHPTTENDA